MSMSRIETTDIFIGAFLLSHGGSLSCIRIKDSARGIASFCIEGEEIERLGHEYGTGHALVNPLHLREQLNHLRDILFELTARGTRHDRQIENRSRKARR